MAEDSEHKWSPYQSVLKYFEGLMAVVYLVLGIVFLWKANVLFNIPPHYAIPFGVVMIAYSIFRGYQVYQKFF
jgi:hypothetical protein